MYIEFVPDWYRDEVGPLVDYVNTHIKYEFHQDVPVYFYDRGSFERVIRLTAVRACGGAVSEECFEAYRRYIVETSDVALARYMYDGRFILVDYGALSGLPGFVKLYVVFHEVLHSVFDSLSLGRVYVRLFVERFPFYLRLIRALYDRGLVEAYGDVIDSIEIVMSELYAVAGGATFLVALRRDCFEDLGVIASYLGKELSLRYALEVLNTIARSYWVPMRVRGRDLTVGDFLPFYGRVCRDVMGVLSRFPVEDYDYWSRRFNLFYDIEVYRRMFEGGVG